MTEQELLKELSLLSQRIKELEQSEDMHQRAEATIPEMVVNNAFLACSDTSHKNSQCGNTWNTFLQHVHDGHEFE